MPSLFFVKDGEKTMANADISLLFGVLGEGSLSGESGSLIQSQLNQIMSAIDKNPFKVKVVLDTDSANKNKWVTQLQKKLDALNNGNKLAITVSNIKLGTSAITSFKNQLGAVINTLNLDKDVSVSFTAKDIGEITAEFKSASDAADEAAKKAAQFNVQMRALGAQESSVKRKLTSLGQIVATDEERAQVAAINAQYEQLAVRIETIRASKTAASAAVQAELMAEVDAIRRNIDALMQSAQAARESANAGSAAAQQTESAEAARMATLNEVISAYKKINDYINKNPRISGTSQYTQLVSMRDELAGIIEESNNLSNSANKAEKNLSTMSRVDLRTMLNSLSQMDIELTEAGKKGKTFVGMLQSAYQKFGGWMLVTRSLMQVINGIRSMVTNVIKLDAAMTELRKVTDETDASYTRFFNNAITRSKQLGATLTDTITATADFARLGYSIEEAANLADAALIYKNVGDGIEDISEASESVISTMKAFGIEATNAMLIVDKFNEVGNNFAISSKGVGDALVRSAAALASAGNSLDESIALVTAANTIVQNPDVVGTTMKTLSMYLRAAKTEAEEAGESTEGMANSISELRSEILALTGGKVDIQIDNDTFKNTTQILRELSGIWEELTDVSQANLLEMIGGKRNANVVASLIENFELVEEVLESSSNAAGSALAENEKYLDSINGKISQFHAAFEALSSAFINSDLVKRVVKFGTVIIEGLTSIIDMLGSIPTLITAITGALTVYQKGKNKANLGLFKPIDGKIKYDPSGIRSVISEYNNLLGKTSEEQSGFIAKLEKSDIQLANYLKTVNDGTASFKGYKSYCKQAGIEAKTLGTTSKAASIGVTLLNTAINMLISLGITLAIQGFIAVITHLANATEEAVERTKELNNAFKEFKETNNDNIKTLESLKGEFDELSKGVSRYGENIALTSDEYERYKEIIETIVGISPSLSEGYNTENGYLADKNGLIERAIELQEQQYRQELRQMTTTENLKTGMEGYIATYGNLRMRAASTIDADLTNSIYRLFRINDRDVVPDFADVNGSDVKSIYLAEQIIKSLGIDDANAEIEKYLNKYGYFQGNIFFDDYAKAIAQNYDKIAASIDYSAIGYKTKTEFDEAVGIVGDAATEYLNVQNQMAEANSGIANQLKLVAEANEDYANLSDEAQSIVSSFINNFGVEDVYRKNFWDNWVPDEDAIDSIRTQINQFIDSITPEINSALEKLGETSNSFSLGNVSLKSFEQSVYSLLAELQNYGLDKNSIKLALDISGLEKYRDELNYISTALGTTRGQYDELLKSLTSEELDIAYRIVNEDDSITIDELLEKIKRVTISTSSSTKNTLDFSNIISGLNEITNTIGSIVSAMEKLNEGTALTREELAKLALEYPDLLKESNLFTDGSIEGQKALLNTILSVRQAEYNALLDEKIAELKATEQVINEQLEMETDKANIIKELERISLNGIIGQEQEFVKYMNELNDLQGANYVTLKEGELQVNDEALENKMKQEADSVVESTEGIWAPYGSAIISAHAQGYEGALDATDKYKAELAKKIYGIADASNRAFKESMLPDGSIDWSKYATSWQNYMDSAIGNATSKDDNPIDVPLNIQIVDENGNTISDVTQKFLDDWVSKQTEASEQRISQLEDYRQRVVNAYTNLESLRDNLDLVSIYGSAREDSSTTDSAVKSVEEYKAVIDEYYAAEKKLEEIQRRRADIERQISRTDDLSQRIRLTGQLVNAYNEEIAAERELAEAKKNTIEANVSALRALGFEIEYNRQTNNLYIRNLEHLNEITAKSVGEYESLQEATNALRQDTEELINTTEDLNSENMDAASAIEDLMDEIINAKKDAIDSIEEIYNKQIESYQKIIDMKKEYIETTKEELDHEQDVADMVDEIAELQTRISLLSLDDSLAAQAERNALLEELAEKQKELANAQEDYSTDSQIEALDKLAENFEAQKKNEIEAMRNSVNSSEALWNGFYQTLMGQTANLGSMINNQIASAWTNAAQAVNSYSNAVNSLSHTGSSLLIGVGASSSTGYLPYSIPRYHDGGVVNNSNLGNDEVLALLKEGEYVLTEDNKLAMYKILDFQSDLASKFNSSIKSLGSNGIITRIKNLFDAKLPTTGLVSENSSYSPNIEVTIYHNGEISDSDAKAYGEKIANSAIDKMYEAFGRRGISPIRGSRLRPANG